MNQTFLGKISIVKIYGIGTRPILPTKIIEQKQTGGTQFKLESPAHSMLCNPKTEKAIEVSTDEVMNNVWNSIKKKKVLVEVAVIEFHNILLFD